MALNCHRIYLPIPSIRPNQSTAYSTPGAEQRSQLNQQCLTAISDWLRTEFDLSVRVYPNNAALPSIWEVVTGTAIKVESRVESRRLVLIPTVAIAIDELRVPQEWVDIPSWIADYYIAMQVDPDQCWIEILGYSSYQQLKTTGVYDSGDRTYGLDIDDLSPDINSLLISWQLLPLGANPKASKTATIVSLPDLSPVRADNLLERLGNPALTFPRRAVSFAQWATLLSHGGWRQRLYEHRQGITDSASVPQWIRMGLSGWAQQVGWQPRECSLAGVGVRSRQSGIAKPLTIAGATYELQVFPIGQADDLTWRIQLRHTTSAGLIPVGFTLRLLTEDLQMMENNEDIATTAMTHLFIDVRLEPGEGLVWEIEPMPEDYDREILRF